MELPEPVVHVRGIPRERGHTALAGQDVAADVPARLLQQRDRRLSAVGGHLLTVH